MAEAGWYTDPEHAGWLRYYDGQQWTEHREQEHSAAQSPGQPQPEAITQALPQPSYAEAPQYSGADTYQQPAYEGWSPTAALPAAGLLTAPPAQRGSRNKFILICAVVVVVVAGLLTGGYFAFLRGSPSLTYQGHKIDDAAGTLRAAETNLNALVTKRHGAKDSDTRCYYAVPKSPASGTKKTDVDSDLRCGPVLFVDGDAAQTYLNFGLTNASSSGAAKLTAASQPEAATPAAIPSELKLERPDGKTAPSGSGGLKVPSPPSADKDALVSADITGATVPAAAATAVMGSLSGGVSLTNLGPVMRYGHGDDARTAPSGEKLIAFKTAGSMGNDGTSTDLSAKAVVSVDGASGRSLPAKTAAYYVVAVPSSAKTVDLVLVDGGLTQSISLLDGKPGPNNIQVLARQNRTATSGATANLTFGYSPEVGFEDGSSGTSQTATATYSRATLSYTDDGGSAPVTASSASTAILHIGLSYTGTHDAGPFAFPAGLVTFTPTGGAAIAAKNAGTDDEVYLVFEVPAGVTTGTITIGGTVNQTYGNSSGTYKESVPTPVSIPFSLTAR
jgi:hypothetical protein